MDNKKNKKMTMVFIVSMLILVVSTTYAFFAPQQGGSTSTNATVTSNTTDLLTFSINRDISFTVTQNDFLENGENQSGDATATARLSPNNKTGAATMNYYLYLNLQNNPTVYSEANTNELPELMLQVFDMSDQLVALTGLGNQITVKGVTGYDITGVTGLKTLLDNQEISAMNNIGMVDAWRVEITLINHDFNQNDNAGKTIEAEIIIRQDEMSLGLTGIVYENDVIEPLPGASLVSVNMNVWCDTEISSGNQSDCFGDQNTCEQFIANAGNSSTNMCQQETYTIEGYSEQDIDVQTFKNYYYYYLKYRVENNLVKSTEACLGYDDVEFCFDSSYWDTDAETTMTKLRSDMELAFGTPADSCDYNSDPNSGYASCDFGYHSCVIYANGHANCQSIPVGCCEVDNSPFASCYAW